MSSPAPTSPASVQAPSGGALAKATLVALVIAAIVLVTAVLPAEYGVDPLGTGKAMGLMALYEADQAAAAASTVPDVIRAAEGGPVFPQNLRYREDARTIEIPPLSGLEFKYSLSKGATMLYEWKADAFVNFDFHTEPAGKPPEASDSFEKGEASQKRGAYTAPYDGIHGWFWDNPTDKTVTVTLNAAGFFTEGKLFKPEQPAETIAIPERP